MTYDASDPGQVAKAEKEEVVLTCVCPEFSKNYWKQFTR